MLSVTPGHQFRKTGDLRIGDAARRVGQPGLRIDAVELGGFDQRIGNGDQFATALGSAPGSRSCR